MMTFNNFRAMPKDVANSDPVAMLDLDYFYDLTVITNGESHTVIDNENKRMYAVDPARLGAQVIAGIGFVGAGTIIVTKNQRVKGLTTAAGLWAVAIVGLALGTGFYEGAIVTTALIFSAEVIFGRMELWLTRRSPEVSVMFECTSRVGIDRIVQLLRQEKVKLLHLEITRADHSDVRNDYVLCNLRLNKKCSIERLIELAMEVEGITNFQEL